MRTDRSLACVELKVQLIAFQVLALSMQLQPGTSHNSLTPILPAPLRAWCLGAQLTKHTPNRSQDIKRANERTLIVVRATHTGKRTRAVKIASSSNIWAVRWLCSVYLTSSHALDNERNAPTTSKPARGRLVLSHYLTLLAQNCLPLLHSIRQK